MLSVSALADETYYEEYTPLYQAASVLVMCANTGVVIYETEGFTRRYPASITKVMTALLVLEYVEDLGEYINFSYHAIDIPEYASRMDMAVGESITVLDALYGIMLRSGNEVTRALAEHVLGSVPAFVERMNERALELGAYDTNFINTCGLPGYGQYVTAYDIALIMQAALQHPIFVEIISTAEHMLRPTNLHNYSRLLRNTNRMIHLFDDEFNPYVVGGKTGFTRAAGHTLVTYVRRDGHEWIITVLYAIERGETFTDTTAIIDYVYENIDRLMPEPEPEPEPEPVEDEPTPGPPPSPALPQNPSTVSVQEVQISETVPYERNYAILTGILVAVLLIFMLFATAILSLIFILVYRRFVSRR